MGKVTDKGSVPPADPMFSGGPRLHSPMPSSELTKSSPPSVNGCQKPRIFAAERGQWVPERGIVA